MTDADRIAQARWLCGEILHDLGVAEMAIETLRAELREAAMLAAMGAAEAVGRVLGGRPENSSCIGVAS